MKECSYTLILRMAVDSPFSGSSWPFFDVICLFFQAPHQRGIDRRPLRTASSLCRGEHSIFGYDSGEAGKRRRFKIAVSDTHSSRRADPQFVGVPRLPNRSAKIILADEF